MTDEKPPFLSLLLRAVIWTPVGLFLTVTWLLSLGATGLLPIIGTIYLWSGDLLLGFGLWLLAFGTFFLSRFLKRYCWETPDSLL